MVFDQDRLDEIIRESVSENEFPDIPVDINLKILDRIRKNKLWKTVIYDFILKILVILSFLVIPLVTTVLLNIVALQDIGRLFLDYKAIILGLGLLLTAILFMNEITSKWTEK